MSILNVILLAIVQGLAELLPVSSSAHVVVAEKLLHLDPSAPAMTLLLVMLHTGTMFAVIVYFWKSWRRTYFSSVAAFKRFAFLLIWATLLTGILGEVIKKIIEKTLFKGQPKAELESLFSRLDLIAPALAAAGVIILIAGLYERRHRLRSAVSGAVSGAAATLSGADSNLTLRQSTIMGLVQGLALPFRGFSRSGTTISAAMLADAPRERAERFSFALAVVLTPAVVGVEALRLLKAAHEASLAGSPIDLHSSISASLLGMVFSFLAGLAALKWLSAWLESGRWYLFGIYCLLASAGVFYLYKIGY
ncbi:undecaprenyl-diphosphate phosphatase [Acidicapsa ligni]|uniref:undecaprenyl-diphosphate phosphatase n=1 Tax=Acidicapsa ligni TaxID=542300 RepID=UPI0021DF92AA|nr:undecaprenyl-diphosphate phosphatase [Acidicapsa ligni]